MTHYDTLGVQPSASASQIAAAYKRKARLVHPDRHQGAEAKVIAEAERAMRAINEAWEVLGDPVHRRVYDESLRPAVRPAVSPGPRPVAAQQHPARRVVPAPPPSRRGWFIAAACLAVVVIGWALATAGGDDQAGPPGPPTSAPVSPRATTVPARGSAIVFHDDQVGFTITYPRAWRELTPSAPDMRLALEASDKDGLDLRVMSIGGVANESTIASYKTLTDSVVYTDPSVKLRRHQLVTLNGRLTYYYVTTYQNRTTGQEGVHEHYFIFDGRRMFALRFQSEPASEYEAQAPGYAQVADSFTVTASR